MTPQMAKDLKRAAMFVTKEECRRFLGRATYGRINRRRGDLIHTSVYTPERMTADELVELAMLQDEVGRLVGMAHPLPTVEDEWRVRLGLPEDAPLPGRPPEPYASMDMTDEERELLFPKQWR